MSQFYFHFRHRNEREEDHDGLDLPDAEAAFLQAAATIREMGSELIGRGINPADCAFEVANADGEILYAIAFSEFFSRDPADAPKPIEPTTRYSSIIETRRRAMAAGFDIFESIAQTRAKLVESQALLTRLNSMALDQPIRSRHPDLG